MHDKETEVSLSSSPNTCAENDRYDRVRMTPATGFEPSFTTGVIEEGLPIPTKLCCHLRQEEAARQTALEQNPIPADDYLTEIDALGGA